MLWTLVLSPAEMDGDCAGTPKSHVFAADPILGWETYALFLPVFIREENTGTGTSQQILIAA